MEERTHSHQRLPGGCPSAKTTYSHSVSLAQEHMVELVDKSAWGQEYMDELVDISASQGLWKGTGSCHPRDYGGN